jgi:integrase
MSRRKEPPRLWLKPAEPTRNGRPARVAVWCIVDGAKRESTGCGDRDIEQAQRKLADYIKAKFEPPTGKGAQLLVVEAIAAYLENHVEQLSSKHSRDFGRATCAPLLQWWSGKTLAQVNGMNCRAYVRWRTAQNRKRHPKSKKPPVKVSDQTARHDLKSLRAALRFYKREVDGELVVPTVTLPSKAPPRTDYFLTRDELAARLRVARQNPQALHVARMLLIGWYTGTRPGAILGLRWLPSPSAGWFDLDAGVLHRRGGQTRITNKRQPPAKIHARLLPHLRRWHRLDTGSEPPITNVIHYQGEPIGKLRRSWDTVAKQAGGTRKDGPHILRHSCCTWLMQAGVDVYEVAGYTGVSVKVLLETYGHHHPAFQENAATATTKRTKPRAMRTVGEPARR